MADTLENRIVTENDGHETALSTAGAWDTTILSFTLCNNADSTDTNLDIYIKDNSNSNTVYYIYKTLSLPAGATFEHTAKIVLDDNDVLYFDAVSTSAQIEGICSYLKQTSQENK